MNRKAFVLLAFVAMIGLSSGFAASVQAQEKEDWNKPLTAHGSAAFMFTIQGLGSFNIGAPGLVPVSVPVFGEFSQNQPQDSLMDLNGVGMKWFLADDIALRVALGFKHSSTKALDTSSFAPGVTAWELGVGAEDHLRPLFGVSPYVGGQLNYGATSSDEPSNQKITYSSHVFAIEALAGFDWFVTHGIAVGAEASLGWMSTGMTSTLTGTNNTTVSGPDHSVIALMTGGLVHVVVYY